APGAAPGIGDAYRQRVLAPAVHPQNGVAATHTRPELHERESRAPLARAGIRARLDPPPLRPLEGFGSAPDALVEREVREGRVPEPRSRHVLLRKLDRVHLQPVRDVVHDGLNAEVALGKLRATEVSRDGLVC